MLGHIHICAYSFGVRNEFLGYYFIFIIFCCSLNYRKIVCVDATNKKTADGELSINHRNAVERITVTILTLFIQNTNFMERKKKTM